MRVGRLFTHGGRRYEPGSDFDIHSVAEFQRSSFIRLYGLSERPPARKKNKKMKADEAAGVSHEVPVLKDLIEEPPTGWSSGDDE